MSNFGERLPQENLEYAHAQLVQNIASRIHPSEEYATLAPCNGLVINITDQGDSYRLDIHGGLPADLKTGELYRSIIVYKPDTADQHGRLATTTIVKKHSDNTTSDGVIIDVYGRPIYLERRYDANWGITETVQPEDRTIAEIHSMLQRSSSAFLPVEQVQAMFSQSNKETRRQWQSLSNPESVHKGATTTPTQALLGWIAGLRS